MNSTELKLGFEISCFLPLNIAPWALFKELGVRICAQMVYFDIVI